MQELSTRDRIRNFQPRYITAYRSGLLESKISVGERMLKNCQLCPRKCEVNRFEEMGKICNTGIYPLVSNSFPHFGEEPCLVGLRGSGTIFFTSCSEDEENPTGQSDNFDIEGTWVLNKWTLTTPTDTTVLTPEQRADTMIYKSDHTYERTLVLHQSITITDTGTWSISGNTLTITDSEGEITIFEIAGEGNNITLTETGSLWSVVEEWVRQ